MVIVITMIGVTILLFKRISTMTTELMVIMLTTITATILMITKITTIIREEVMVIMIKTIIGTILTLSLSRFSPLTSKIVWRQTE